MFLCFGPIIADDLNTVEIGDSERRAKSAASVGYRGLLLSGGRQLS